ncbi:MAG TPA: bifunctional ornithine acetyltransferase/N-acetylglutamate synthase, partial [Clostridia bacterium]|nr:bifunctional ornithine acetyltransferase/N-acetylglutamate synthase [Clostridia bacterium]
VKAAMFGADANWGRILCAIGYSGADVDINRINVSFCSDTDALKVCEKGYGVYFSEELAKEILSQDEITIIVDLNAGEHEATAYGCDLTYDYVKINGDYRT